MSRRTSYTLVAAVALVLVGLFVWRFGDSTGPVDPDDPDAILLGWKQVDEVPLDASAVALPGLAGVPDGLPQQGTYLLNLWYSTCAPCKAEMPWLAQLATSGEVAVIGVTRDTIKQSAIDLMRETGVRYANYWDPDAEFWYTLEGVAPTQAAPSSLIVVDGKVTWVHVGPFDSYADLRDSVAERL